jgi:3D (Asp-Asp-Asp) domain-containing protein
MHIRLLQSLIAIALLFLNTTQGEARQAQTVSNTGSEVCSTAPTHTSLAIMSRKGRPQLQHKPLASRHKLLNRPMTLGVHIHVQATAYALYGHTATGTYVHHGSIAVDPRLIPFGSEVYVPGYGWGKAEDTGGAIRGHIIDLWMPTNSECCLWGRRDVDIVVRPPR